MASNDDDLYINAKKNCQPTSLEDYGYFFFPERFGKERTRSLLQRLGKLAIPFDNGSRDIARQIECEQSIAHAIKNNPMVQTLVKALADNQCPIDLNRHFSCEYCDDAMPDGMFDPATNQIVVCRNQLGHFESGMINGLVQAFDYCRNKYDVHNLRHFACSQIRALNFTDCNIVKGCYMDFRVKNRYNACLQSEAENRLRMLRSVDYEEAKQIVREVFKPCRFDTAPFGDDPKLISKTRFIFNDYERFQRWSQNTQR